MSDTGIEVVVVDAQNTQVGKVRLPDAFTAPVNDAVLFENHRLAELSRCR